MHTMAYFVYVGSLVTASTSPYESSSSYFCTARGFSHHGLVASCNSGFRHNCCSLTVREFSHVFGLKRSCVYHTSLVSVLASPFVRGLLPSTLVIIGLHSSVSR